MRLVIRYTLPGNPESTAGWETMKPTDNELEMAIVAAREMRTLGEDHHHVAVSLLYLYQRQQDLEKIRAAAEDYLDSGQDGPQKAALARAVAAARENEQRIRGITGEEPETDG